MFKFRRGLRKILEKILRGLVVQIPSEPLRVQRDWACEFLVY